jgi:hypothetical protein
VEGGGGGRERRGKGRGRRKGREETHSSIRGEREGRKGRDGWEKEGET